MIGSSFGDRGKTCGRVGLPRLRAPRLDAPRLRAGIVSASVLLRTPLGEAGGQVDQVHEQAEEQHTQRPLDAVHRAVRFEPEA